MYSCVTTRDIAPFEVSNGLAVAICERSYLSRNEYMPMMMK